MDGRSVKERKRNTAGIPGGIPDRSFSQKTWSSGAGGRGQEKDSGSADKEIGNASGHLHL